MKGDLEIPASANVGFGVGECRDDDSGGRLDPGLLEAEPEGSSRHKGGEALLLFPLPFRPPPPPPPPSDFGRAGGFDAAIFVEAEDGAVVLEVTGSAVAREGAVVDNATDS